MSDNWTVVVAAAVAVVVWLVVEAVVDTCLGLHKLLTACAAVCHCLPASGRHVPYKERHPCVRWQSHAASAAFVHC